MNPSNYLPYINNLLAKFPDWAPKSPEKLKIALVGFGQPGKTTLLKRLFGDQENAAFKGADGFGIEGSNLPAFCSEGFSFERIESLRLCSHQDLTIHLIDASKGVTAESQRLHEMLIRCGAHQLTVFNKCDTISASQENALILQCYRSLGLTRLQVPQISAATGAGLDALADQIHDALPKEAQEPFARQQKASIAVKQKHVNPLIYKASLEAGTIALAPMPLGDMPLLTALQILMIIEIGGFYGVELSPKRALEFIATVGAGFGFREIARQAIKLIPGAGQVISSGVAAAGTLALGKTAQIWFQRNQSLTQKQLRNLHAQQKRLVHQNSLPTKSPTA